MSEWSLSASVEALSGWTISHPGDQGPRPVDLRTVFQSGSGDRLSAITGTDAFFIEVPDEASVVVDCARRHIRLVAVATRMGHTDVQQFLDDHIAPRILSHEGAFLLHAGSVQTGEDCLLIAGDTGLGKSTLTGSLDAAGWPLMGDDAVLFTLTGTAVLARSTYRRLSLLPDSLRQIAGIDAGPDPAQDHKHRVALTGHPPRSGDLPVAAILVLADDGAAAPVLTRLSASRACLALVANSFALDPSDPSRALARMRQATDIASHVPIFSLDYPRQYAMLPIVRELIASQLARLGVALPQGKPHP